MAGMNFRNTDGFDQDDSDAEGGLLGMLRRAMQEQGMSNTTAPAATSVGALGYNSDDDDSPPRGLLGRLLALQAEQNLQVPLMANNRQISPEPAKPSSEQVSRAFVTSGSQGAIGSAGLWGDQPPSSYPSIRDSTSRDARGALAQNAATAQLVVPGRRIAVFPSGQGPKPPIPAPAIPDWWRDAWAILQLYPRIISGSGDGAENDDDCIEERREARKICTDAFANGWKSDYGVGPYKTSSGKPWSIQDCMRGLISERCGGNAVDK